MKKNQINILELMNTVAEIKISVQGFICRLYRLDRVEKRNSELEDRSEESIKNKAKISKRMKNTEES